LQEFQLRLDTILAWGGGNQPVLATYSLNLFPQPVPQADRPPRVNTAFTVMAQHVPKRQNGPRERI
jgi:hypothetical protein